MKNNILIKLNDEDFKELLNILIIYKDNLEKIFNTSTINKQKEKVNKYINLLIENFK